MSESSAPQRAQEISLDLDGGHEHESDERTRPRISNTALVFATVIMLTAAAVIGVGKFLDARTPEAVRAVADYLDAVRAGDVDTAMSFTFGEERGNSLLSPEALDDRWEVREVAQVGYEQDPQGRDRDEATVYAEIEAFDGTRLGHRFTVVLREDGPRIARATSTAEFEVDELGWLEVNGHFEKFDRSRAEQLLPGVYEFYESTPDTLDFQMAPVLALGDKFIRLGDDHTVSGVGAPWPRVSEEGMEQVDQLVAADLDRCAAAPDDRQCPLRLPADEPVKLAEGAKWTVTDYPKVMASGWYTEALRFELVTLEPGAAEIEVQTGRDGADGTTVVSCAIRVDGMTAQLDDDGGVDLGSGEAEPCTGLVEV